MADTVSSPRIARFSADGVSMTLTWTQPFRRWLPPIDGPLPPERSVAHIDPNNTVRRRRSEAGWSTGWGIGKHRKGRAESSSSHRWVVCGRRSASRIRRRVICISHDSNGSWLGVEGCRGGLHGEHDVVRNVVSRRAPDDRLGDIGEPPRVAAVQHCDSAVATDDAVTHDLLVCCEVIRLCRPLSGCAPVEAVLKELHRAWAGSRNRDRP